MTNGEKFKTERERMRAFNKVCGPCEKVKCDRCHALECFNAWLSDEAKEEIALPCPFCGGTDVVMQDVGGVELVCLGCGFTTPAYMEKEKLISEYQRVARAVLAAKVNGETVDLTKEIAEGDEVRFKVVPITFLGKCCCFFNRLVCTRSADCVLAITRVHIVFVVGFQSHCFALLYRLPRRLVPNLKLNVCFPLLLSV